MDHTPNIYSYDCKQPDPQIWEGGSTIGLFSIISGPDYSERTFRKYDLEITPGSSATGLLSVSGGISAEQTLKRYVGEVATYLTSDFVYENIIYIPEINKKLINEEQPDIVTTGSALTHVIYNTPEEIISIDLLISSIEKTGYSYNQSSLGSFSTENYSTISESVTSSIDYGELTSIPSQGDEDFGFVFDSVSSLNPFGNITVTGSALVIDPPDIKTYNTGATYKVIYNPPETTTSLLSSGEKEESVRYSYNRDSIKLVISENTGLITESVTETDDLGFIIDPVTGILDYEGIDISSTNVPFGTMFLNGSATTEYNNVNFYQTSGLVKVVYSPDETAGTLFNFGNIIENITYSYNINSSIEFIINDFGSITGSYGTNVESYGLIDELPIAFEELGLIEVTSTSSPFGTFNIGGSANTLYVNTNFYDNITTSKVRVAYSPDNTTGTLFNFGDKSESITYNYNLSSTNLLVIEDSGLITSSPTQVIDGGLISSLVSEQNSYGDLYLTSSQTPFGGTVISGSADIIYHNANFYDNITTSKVRVAYSPDNTTGTLFNFGDKSESITYNYNNNSILTFVVDNFGLVSNPSTETSDYGYVNEAYGEQIDNGLNTGLGQNQTISPFGNISIFGSSGTVLVTYGQENTILFAIYGGLTHPNIDYIPAVSGIGTAYISGSSHNSFVSQNIVSETLLISATGLESKTHSYNETSIVLDVTPSYGLISEPTTESGDDYGSIVGSNGETIELGFIPVGIQSAYPFGTITISGVPLVHPEVDYTPKYTGNGTFTISSSATYSETDAFGVGRRRGGNINLCGDATYSETDSYVGFGTIVLDREGVTVPALIARTRSYVGIETIILSDGGLESRTVFIPTSGIGTGFIGGLITIQGNATESYSAQTPEDTQLFTFFGELNHPQIDYTPHYGIEKNIGVGTTGIQISGVVNDSANRFARGVGQIFIVNGFSPQDTETYPGGPSVGRSWSFTRTTYIAQGSLNISSGIAQTHYYSPIYPRNALIGDPSSGIGTIRLNDDSGLTITRAVLPYFAKGGIFVSGIGNESFTPQTEIGSGLFTFSGIASTREIAVYQGYVTSGVITISQQTAGIIEKNTEAYFGFGTIFVSQSLAERDTETYFGSGTISALSGDSESYSAQTPEETVTITVSGSAQESFVAQTPEDTVLYQFLGSASDEKLVKAYSGSGLVNVSGFATIKSVSTPPASGTIRFANTYHVDNLYDTCDSVDVTSDKLYSANVSFTVNPPEDTILFDINGNAITSETALYTETSVGLYTLSGTYQSVKLVHSESGIGTVFITSTSSQSERDVYIGSGTLFTLSGRSESYSAQTPESTIILQISGSALTSLESEYSSVGIGLFTFTGSAVSRIITSYTHFASGIITLSGQLVYPDVIYVPSPDGSGTINIIGSSDDSLIKIYQTFGNLFSFSSGFESFTKSTYIGIGTVYVQEISGLTVNNPFQIPRTYVIII